MHSSKASARLSSLSLLNKVIVLVRLVSVPAGDVLELEWGNLVCIL